ncbi:hypothetical protein D918_07719 [Trichuris suis]|nr:hypothetical protein D918_07719 [Trichuris suis]
MFSGVPVLEQYHTSHNSDIFMGVHGSGLTHMFFLPDWAAVFETFHCEDPECYRDLAYIRGVGFFSWTRSDLVVYENKANNCPIVP